MPQQRRRRQYGSGSVFQRNSDGRWIGVIQAGWNESGTRKTVRVSASTEAECKHKVERRRRELEEQGDTGKDANLTVKAWSEKWLENTQAKLRPNSWTANRSAVRKWIVPAIGHKHLRALTPDAIREVHRTQRAAGGADNSVLRTHTALTKMLKDAVADGHVVPSRVLQVDKPAPGVNAKDAIPPDQAHRIVQAALQHGDGSRWLAALYTGMRQAECLGLTWDAVDMDRGIIEVSWQLAALPYLDKHDRTKGFRVPAGYERRHLVGAMHLVRPKSKAGSRLVPMLPALRVELQHHVSYENPTGLVWTQPNGRPWLANTDRQRWRQVQAEAGVARPDGTPWGLHEARHGLGSILLALNVPQKIMQAIMGHSSVAASQTYQHETLEQIEREMVRVGEYLALAAKA